MNPNELRCVCEDELMLTNVFVQFSPPKSLQLCKYCIKHYMSDLEICINETDKAWSFKDK